jgi:hypothetical protein
MYHLWYRKNHLWASMFYDTFAAAFHLHDQASFDVGEAEK